MIQISRSAIKATLKSLIIVFDNNDIINQKNDDSRRNADANRNFGAGREISSFGAFNVGVSDNCRRAGFQIRDGKRIFVSRADKTF